MTPEDRAFAFNRSGLVAAAWLTNLRVAPDMPYAFTPHEGERSGTVVCVGAGPSLSQTGPELARLKRDGALICTVNTALPAVAKYVDVDVVLARETVDVSSHLRHPAALRVLDLGASPAVWDTAREMGPCAWFVAGSLNTFELARSLDVRPLFGGPAALTSLVALCAEWGAAEIVLVGCDLAIAEDGKSYADGSAFGGQRAEIGEDGVATSSGAGLEEKQRQHAAAGCEPYPTRWPVVEAERWGGGGTLRTTGQWLPQVEWLSAFADRRPGIRCIDATGAGARKPGWDEDRLGTLTFADGLRCSRGLSRATPRHALHGHRVAEQMHAVRMRDAVRAHLLAQADAAEEISVNVLHPAGDPAGVPGLLDGHDVVDMFAARSLLIGNETQCPQIIRMRHAYGKAYMDAAKRVREMML